MTLTCLQGDQVHDMIKGMCYVMASSATLHLSSRKLFNHSLVYWQEKVVAPHSSTLAWKIPWTEESGGLQSMGLLRVRHDWAISLSLFPFMHWRRKWQPTPVFLPGESQGQRSLVGRRLWGRTVGHDWSDLAAAAVYWQQATIKEMLDLWESSNFPSGRKRGVLVSTPINIFHLLKIQYYQKYSTIWKSTSTVILLNKIAKIYLHTHNHPRIMSTLKTLI